MKILRLLSILLFLASPALAQQRDVVIATTHRVGLVKPDGTTITMTPDGTITAVGGGGGGGTNSPTFLQATQIVTGIKLPIQLGGGWIVQQNTNNGDLIVTNTVWGAMWMRLQTNNVPGFPGLATFGAVTANGKLAAFNALIVGGITNSALTASTDVGADANKMFVSLPNAPGIKTNDGAGNMGWTLILPPGIDGRNLTNILNGNIVLAGNNITITYSTNAAGKITGTIAVSDPASFSSVTSSTVTATTFVVSTNQFAGTVVDFNHPYSTTNLNGNLTFTDVANVNASADNEAIIYMGANGADRQVTAAAAWGTVTNVFLSGSTYYLTNGTKAKFLIQTQVGFTTNITMVSVSK